ncbi:MAG: hypothetical protein V1773_18965 [bacterium]
MSKDKQIFTGRYEGQSGSGRSNSGHPQSEAEKYYKKTINSLNSDKSELKDENAVLKYSNDVLNRKIAELEKEMSFINGKEEAMNEQKERKSKMAKIKDLSIIFIGIFGTLIFTSEYQIVGFLGLIIFIGIFSLIPYDK